MNRPGLVLAGFTRYFANRRIQVIGNAEACYLRSLPKAERTAKCQQLFKYKFPCLVFSRNLNPDRLLLREVPAPALDDVATPDPPPNDRC